ncbi:MAG: phospho-N-acetylmuramoyl-pentapeptide-transferase [Bacteroidota bacterium]|jgi:phospho-N-acetylmuramoyl-pentapeptide-transferase|nr:phospho-N-acetylmuramoyl-pentapeptide-transferase [Cytophagia bacterium]MEC7260218.1 phospho-N-acetylmuramoyl-pentapeptide-transferase [Bacteroidota bacterium]|tara:strand:+ start:605 stop:1807 length:1203 start_codon:yes stop_codon:yes gene_type:complete
MLYHLFEYLQQNYDLAGSGVFQYLSFRAGMAALFSLIISIIFGKNIISILQNFQLSEKIRDLDLKGQSEKEGTPTMGGIIIIISILVPTILFADLSNIYIQLMIFITVIISVIGFIDDYLKIKKKDKVGLKGKFKILGQILIGIIVSYVVVTNDSVVVRDFLESVTQDGSKDQYVDSKDLLTTIPFIKDNEFNYEWITPNFINGYTWLIYSLVVIFIIVSVSNGANITDGLDGLAAGVSAIVGITLSIFIYLSGNLIFSDYLNIMYIPGIGELVIFSFAFVGACIGFIWYNSYPAQVFMGDIGSLSIGAIIAVLAIIVKKELLIPVMCGIFLIENLSVIIQVTYFKYTKKKYGEGKRIFLMSPLHHHYQKKGIHETKIVARFWMVGILLAIISLATLKLR